MEKLGYTIERGASRGKREVCHVDQATREGLLGKMLKMVQVLRRKRMVKSASFDFIIVPRMLAAFRSLFFILFVIMYHSTAKS